MRKGGADGKPRSETRWILPPMATRGPRSKGKPFGEQLGERLKDIRERRGLTQEQLAQAVKMNAARISDYESGRIVPKLEKAVALAAALAVTLDELVGRTTPEVAEDVRDPRLRAGVSELEKTGNARLVEVAGATVEAYVVLAHHEALEQRRPRRP